MGDRVPARRPRWSPSGPALDPEFADNGLVYLYFTTPGAMKLERWRFDGGTLTREADLIGATFWHRDFLFAALRREALHRLTLDGDRITGDQTLLKGEYGRLRTVVVGPDDALYVLTSNRDGRGDPDAADDRILRIEPSR